MMRIALQSEIREGAVEAYERAHVRIPVDLATTFAQVGIHDWSIWRSGRRLFHLVECEDWDAAIETLEADPANARWQSDIGRFVECFRDRDGAEGMAPLGEVWRLSRQRHA